MPEPVLSEPHPVEHIRASETARSHNLSDKKLPGQRSTSPPGHEIDSDENRGVRTSLSWNQNLSIRFIAGNEIFEREQPVIYQTEYNHELTPKVYLMLCALSLDTSKQELLYTAHWSSPRSTNDQVDF